MAFERRMGMDASLSKKQDAFILIFKGIKLPCTATRAVYLRLPHSGWRTTHLSLWIVR